MAYQLGVDIGTTFTAAAVHRETTSRIVSLSDDSTTIPTIVSAMPDGTVGVGSVAASDLHAHPDRIAKEFKRRIGDPTPIELGDHAHQASWYMAQVLAAVVAAVTEAEGASPDRIALTHPANWSDQKISRLLQGVGEAGLRPEATVLLTEPEAAARAHAATRAITDGETIAVYDLGGGTFDTAVLRHTEGSYTILGRPEGIERLGGLDFDMALLRYVTSQLGSGFKTLDLSDPAVARGIVDLRDECIQAKEHLSFVTEVEVPVEIPGLKPKVEVDRRSFEALVRPALMETIGALRRVLGTAGIEACEVSQILVAGGSSRIPLVTELLGEVLERPVSIDRDPKHVVAIGAAQAAADAGDAEDLGGPFADDEREPALAAWNPSDLGLEPENGNGNGSAWRRGTPPTPATATTRVAPLSAAEPTTGPAPRPERRVPTSGSSTASAAAGTPTSTAEAALPESVPDEETDAGGAPDSEGSPSAETLRPKRRWSWPRSRR